MPVGIAKAEGMSEMGTVRTSILGGMRFLLFYKNFSIQPRPLPFWLPLAFSLGCFRSVLQHLALSLQPFLAARANEKFHLSSITQHGNSKFAHAKDPEKSFAFYHDSH